MEGNSKKLKLPSSSQGNFYKGVNEFQEKPLSQAKSGH